MVLPLPKLDDLTYETLVKEAVRLIPHYNEQWTNFNPSDPGITLLELFSFIIDNIAYRLEQVPDAVYANYFKLLGFTDDEINAWTVEQGIQKSIERVSTRHRAVTKDDYELLALQAFSTDDEIPGRILCAMNHDGSLPDEDTTYPGHVTVFVFPKQSTDGSWQPSVKQLDTIYEFLYPKRLITTRLHVIGPFVRPVRVALDVVLNADANSTQMSEKITSGLTDFFSPITGGSNQSGWEMGRGVYPSELYHLIENIEGVHHVEGLTLFDNGEEATQGDAIELKPLEVVSFDSDKSDIGVRYE